jgi:antitoxin VapB
MSNEDGDKLDPPPMERLSPRSAIHSRVNLRKRPSSPVSLRFLRLAGSPSGSLPNACSNSLKCPRELRQLPQFERRSVGVLWEVALGQHPQTQQLLVVGGEVLEVRRGRRAQHAVGAVYPGRWAYTYVYGVRQREEQAMQRRAKVFMNNRSQAVRLPKEFQFGTDEVFIRKEGEDVILSPRPTDWGPYLDSGPVASDAFMENIEDLPVQEREP